jgi:hypothetical protein
MAVGSGCMRTSPRSVAPGLRHGLGRRVEERPYAPLLDLDAPQGGRLLGALCGQVGGLALLLSHVVERQVGPLELSKHLIDTDRLIPEAGFPIVSA